MDEFPRTLQRGANNVILLDDTRLLVATRVPTDLDTVSARLGPADIVLEDAGEEHDVLHTDAVNHTDTRFWVRSAGGQPIDQQRMASIRALLGGALDWLGPVYRQRVPPGRPDRAGLLCPSPHVLLVRQQAGGPASPQAAVAAVAGGDTAVTEDTERSRHLGPFHYLVLADPAALNAYHLRDRLLASGSGFVAGDIEFESMPMTVATTIIPNDPLFTGQWHLTRIEAPAAWNVTTGSSNVVVAVIDSDFDLNHPDIAFGGNGPSLTGALSADHGTACAGIVAATFDNAIGVAGLAATCDILPARSGNFTETDIAQAIDWARLNGADIISMSLGKDTWSPTLIDAAIANADAQGILICVSTGNYDGPIIYPATNPLVMAVGATDQLDDRKRPASPDGQKWGSNFGSEISVAAPGVLIPTTDVSGAGGFNANGGGGNVHGVYYSSLGDPAGDYIAVFGGTSAATPQVAGLAALLLSAHPGMTGAQARTIIESTAEKTGTTPYATVAGHANGTWNDRTGYGRINVRKALNFADVLIPHMLDGSHVLSAEHFWEIATIVIHIADDALTAVSRLVAHEAHLVSVPVHNNGPQEARNVVTTARLIPFAGTQFVFPDDWTAVDELHVFPAPVRAHFPVVPAGETVTAWFALSAEQVDVLRSGLGFPSVLVSVTADNDHAFTTATAGGTTMRSNNLAQRSVSTVVATPDGDVSFPFVAGHPLNPETVLELVIDGSDRPRAMPLTLALDPDARSFPHMDLDETPVTGWAGSGGDGMVFLDRTRVRTRLGHCEGVLTLEPGSRFDCMPGTGAGEVEVTGGDLITRDGRRSIRIREAVATVRLATAPGRLLPLVLSARFPAGEPGLDTVEVSVAQRNLDRTVVGGTSVRFALG